MTKVSITRQEVMNLWTAINAASRLEIPAKARYAFAKSKPNVLAELKATEEAYPEPKHEEFDKLVEIAMSKRTIQERNDGVSKIESKPEFADHIKARKEWIAKREPHLKEKVEIELFKVDVFDINDITAPNETIRNQNNQALIEWLMPLFN